MKRLHLFLLLLSFTGAAASAAEERPNFVFIVADDLRWDCLGYAGHPTVQTPHLDALARRGTVFTRAFVTTSICSVSRASIFSGQYARRHGIMDFATTFTAGAWAQTYPALLRGAGYYTGFIGKFGVGAEPAIRAKADAFDVWHGLPGQAGLFIQPNDASRTHATARFGGQALDFIHGAPKGKPFCLSISFSAPHARDGKPREFEPDPRDEALYADAPAAVPTKAATSHFAALPAEAHVSEGRKRWERRFADAEMAAGIIRDYWRLVTGIDREVGRIVEALERAGVADNTVVIFTSDNGFFLGERGLADKWLMYEESIRVPLVISDPRLPAATRRKQTESLALLIDLAPTMLGMAGVAAPSGMQGRSLEPLMRGEHPGDWRTDFFYEHHVFPDRIPATEGVRDERWKYTRWVNSKPIFEELFDLETDPGEEVNLAGDPHHAERLAQHRARWEVLRGEVK